MSLFAAMESAMTARRNVKYGIMTLAFGAMFKSNIAVPTVTQMLRHILALFEVPGLRPTPATTLGPHFACVNFDSSKIYESLNLGYDPLQRCLASSRGVTVKSFYAEGTAYIFICPVFFFLTPKPTSRICPKVSANRFQGSQRDLHQSFQTFALLYNLIRFYLGKNALDSYSLPPEEFDWNRCVFNLNVIESIVNPTNLELYIACTSTHDCSLVCCFDS